jgi:GNAT superfamily N-acetyltransferase
MKAALSRIYHYMWYRAANSEIRFEFQHYPDEKVSEVLAYIGDEMVGNMEFAHTKNGIITRNTYLEPEHRGRGYGKAMYQFAWNKLKSLSSSPIRSDTLVQMDARRVYESLMQSPEWDIQRPEDGLSRYTVNPRFSSKHTRMML